MSDLTQAERRYMVAKAHAERLHAAAYAAQAEACRLNPWVPEAFRKRDAESCMTQAARHLDNAAEAEAEATEEMEEA